MSTQLSLVEFEGGPTLCVPGGETARQANERARRLRDWALVWGGMTGGRPFVRAGEGCGPYVHIPTRVRISPRADAGVSSDALPAGPGVVVRGVPFEEWERVARSIAARLHAALVASGPVEFHTSDEDFERGDVRIPVTPFAAPRSSRSAREAVLLRQ